MSGKLGRIFLLLGLLLLIALFAWETMAQGTAGVQIIEVRRNIPLADTDPVYKDFYINAGSEAGLRPNLVVTAVRKVNIKDNTGTQTFGELMVPVAQLKIIFVQSQIAVAREHKPLSRDTHPMLEQTGIMSGDLIELKGSFVDNSKPSDRTADLKETATETAPSPEEPATTPIAAGLSPAVVQKTVMDSMAEAITRVADKVE